jgi:23S rRNA A1618 N6-methylase RlmF
LCPTIPQKLNYIHWIEDLLALQQRAGGGGDCGGGAQGVDVGTGASCIYPLLGTALHPDWSFVATEVDARSRASATANVARNGLQVRGQRCGARTVSGC